MSLWHSGDTNECHRWIDEANRASGPDSQHRVTDSWIGNDICLMRIEVSERLLDTLSASRLCPKHRSAREGRLLTFGTSVAFRQTDIEIIPRIKLPLDQLTGVVVVDSGVVAGTSGTRSCVIGDAQSFVEGDDPEARTSTRGKAATERPLPESLPTGTSEPASSLVDSYRVPQSSRDGF